MVLPPKKRLKRDPSEIIRSPKTAGQSPKMLKPVLQQFLMLSRSFTAIKLFQAAALMR